MSDFRPGDRMVTVNAVPTRLRLTVSALAEIADLTNTDSPTALANRLRQSGQRDGVWQGILRALATPRPKRDLPEDDMAEILPGMATVIAKGLGS